jgi:hypothetical protein
LVNWVKDKTGRFPQRPHYEPSDLDFECEQIVNSFLKERHGAVVFPIVTDDLTVLIEGEADDLDLYADLSSEPGEVEGVTDFFPGKKPRVRISKTLSENPIMGNRLRTTLTHEFGHIRFHGFLYDAKTLTPSLFPVQEEPQSHKCKRENILNAGQYDWMEWQAGYVCGAVLMPISPLKEIARTYLKERAIATIPLVATSLEGRGLIRAVSSKFQVSEDAARVRLSKLSFLVGDESQMSRALFK